MQHDNHASGVNPYAVATPTANPYAAPTSRVEQYVEHNDGVVLASRGARLGAHLLDTLLYGLCFIGIIMAAVGAGARTAGALALLGVLAGLGLFAANLVMLHRHGQSVGKRIVGIRIVRSDGSRCALGRIVGLRMGVPILISLIPFAGYVFGLLDPLSIFREERRCIHDHIADTIVVDA